MNYFIVKNILMINCNDLMISYVLIEYRAEMSTIYFSANTMDNFDAVQFWNYPDV